MISSQIEIEALLQLYTPIVVQSGENFPTLPFEWLLFFTSLSARFWCYLLLFVLYLYFITESFQNIRVVEEWRRMKFWMNKHHHRQS